MSKLYSFNRRGEVMEVKPLTKNSSQEDIWAMEALIERRGVFKDVKEANKAALWSKPIRVNTGSGPNDYYYE